MEYLLIHFRVCVELSHIVVDSLLSYVVFIKIPLKKGWFQRRHYLLLENQVKVNRFKPIMLHDLSYATIAQPRTRAFNQ